MIVARDLTFRYRRNAPNIIEHLDHEFQRGTMTALTGPSGGGKSTLLYVLGLMLTAAEGALLIDGNDTLHLTDGERSALRARYMGFVFQDAMLDPSRTVLDNVLEGALYSGRGKSRAHDRALELLHAVGVVHRFDHKPGEISGGQAQRVALCRALLRSPDVILADEPTGNLDPDSAKLVWRMLEQAAAAGACVIVATHDPVAAGQCHQWVTLK